MAWYDRLAVGVDIGGTKMAAGVVDADGIIIDRITEPTRSDDRVALLDAIASIVNQFRRDHHVRAVGIGAAGFIDASQSTVVFAPHLPWRREPLRDAVSRRTGLPVLVDNDANAAGWAEWRFGSAQNQADVIQINLGTGIGGALVIDGLPYRGHFGMAGEFGHMQVVPNGLACPCGNSGCWEQYASGRALERMAAAELLSGSAMAHELIAAAGGREQVTGVTVGALALAGHRQAAAWLADVGHWLGVGLANVAAALDPAMFVIGGGVAANGELLLAPAREAFSATLTGRGFRAEAQIVAAHLGSDAGLIGAADMARFTARRRRQANPSGRVRAKAGSSPARRQRPRPPRPGQQ